jgi:hypothetical protein
MKRLFTFGCSFTNYRWSTWADCLAPEFDYFENWGQSGAGNHFIFNSIIEADQRYNFGPYDTVVVCWTNVMREDRYTDRWQTLGNVTTCPIYNPDYVRDAVTERGCLVRDLAMIKAATVLFNSKRRPFQWQYLSMCPIGNPQQFDNVQSQDQDVLDLYNGVLNKILPSFQETIFKNGWKQSDDPHPTPDEHLAYLDTVLPGWVTKQQTRVKILHETNNLCKDRSGLSTVQRL